MAKISRDRGHNFERKIARELSSWAGVSAITTRALKSTQKYIEDFPHPSGDIVLAKPWNIIVECKKGYPKFNLLSKNIVHLQGWIAQAKSETPTNWDWFIVYSGNNSNSISIISDAEFYSHERIGRLGLHKIPNIYIVNPVQEYWVMVFNYHEFLATVKPNILYRELRRKNNGKLP